MHEWNRATNMKTADEQTFLTISQENYEELLLISNVQFCVYEE